MLEPILGSLNRERVLIFLLARGEGYGREIARYFETDVNPIQKQLVKLENGGVLVSHSVGRTRLYSFNPDYPLLPALTHLLKKALAFYPEQQREKLIMHKPRSRPRSKRPENLSTKWNSWQPES